jgi:hypothetical protein
LGESLELFLLAFPASLQTSTVQADNRTTGEGMTLIKKIDVDKYFAAKRATQRAGALIVTGLGAAEPVPSKTTGTKVNAKNLAGNHPFKHTSPSAAGAPSK